MVAARRLEVAALERVAARSELTLGELAARPAYLGAVPNPDCVYDGDLIEFSHRSPVLADGGELAVGVLGPLWDRIFRLEFSGVTSVQLRGFGPSLSMDLKEIVLRGVDGVQECVLAGLSFPTSVTVAYTSCRVFRLVLESPIKRSELGT